MDRDAEMMLLKVGGMRPQALECWQAPGAEGGRKEPPLEPWKMVWPLPHPDFGLLASKL